MLRFCCRQEHLICWSRSNGEVKSISMAQVCSDLELLGCSFLGCRSIGCFTLADVASTRCSGVTFSVRGDIECMGRGILAGSARDDSFGAHFLLLLSASDPFVACQA